MLPEESVWIGNKIDCIINENSYPILNVGSSTAYYRTKAQPYVQQNIFSKIPNEHQNVIHLDIKDAPGVDVVGDLYDDDFLEKIKALQVKTILCNNTLMYLEEERRKKLSEIFYHLLDKNGYLIVSNSLMFPAAPDPKEAYYRDSSKKMYENLFSKFTLLDAKDVETPLTHFQDLKSQSKVLLLKKLIAFFIFTAKTFKKRDWKFLIEYYTKNLHKNYSASCMFLQK